MSDLDAQGNVDNSNIPAYKPRQSRTPLISEELLHPTPTQIGH